MVRKLRTLTLILVLTPFTGGCKLRNDGSQTRGTAGSDLSAKSEQAFATCTNTSDQGVWNIEVYQDITTERARLKYWQTPNPKNDSESSDPRWAAGVWENADERTPFERLYIFGELSLIITLDRTPTGFNPATMTGKTPEREPIDQSFMCVLKQ
jgi:hypothetical protein